MLGDDAIDAAGLQGDNAAINELIVKIHQAIVSCWERRRLRPYSIMAL